MKARSTILGDRTLRLLVAAITLLGFAARVYRLGAKSLWLDEGLSVSFAGHPVRELLGLLISQDIHPPLSYLILHFWMGLAGQSELAVRFPALLTGTALIPATYALARALTGGAAQARSVSNESSESSPIAKLAVPALKGRGMVRGRPEGRIRSGQLWPRRPYLRHSWRGLRTRSIGERSSGTNTAAALSPLLAAALVAASPFLVSYSQEARMYSDLALWGVLSSYSLWKGLRRASGHLWPVVHTPAIQGRDRIPNLWLVAYAVATALGLYTHYFMGLVVAFQAVYVGILSLRRPRTGLGWAVALFGAGLLYLPWLVGVFQQINRLATSPDFWKGELSLTFIVEKVFTAFALGKSGVPVQSLPLIVGAALLFGVGLLVLLRWGLRGRQADLFALLYLLIPLLALYAVSARNPKFTERYLIVIAPIFYLILARALVALAEVGRALERRWAGAPWASRALAGLIVLGVLGASAGEVRRVYFGPGYEKDDNRAAVAYIQAHEQPGDVVILMMNSDHVFKYYYRGNLPYYGLHPGDDTVYAADRLNEILAGKKRLWLLLWQESWADPTGFTRDTIDAHLTWLAGPGDYMGLKLQLYGIEQPVHFTADLAPQRAVAANFDGKLDFLGYDPPARPVAAGETADFGLYWQAKQPLDLDYVVSLRLVGDGFRWVRQDQRPAAYTYPTTSWKVGRTVWGKVSLPIPPGTPPGDYDLELVVYPQETKRDLNVLGPDGRPVAPRTVIGKLTVGRPTTPADPAKLSVPRPLDQAFGDDLRLLGSELGAESVRPGAGLDIALFWQALGKARGDDAVKLTLVDSAGQSTVLSEARPSHGRYATSGWAQGELVVDRYHLVVPPTAAPGPARLLLGVSRLLGKTPLATSDGDSVTLGTLQVGERPKLGERPTDVQHPLDLRFGDFATLIGYTLKSQGAKPGGELALTLYWQARGSAAASYTVFTHLLDGESKVWGQQDNVPAAGANPTTGWLPDEYVRDEYRLPIKPDAPPGQYSIEVGMYDPQTGARLKLTGPNGADAGDRLILQTIEVR